MKQSTFHIFFKAIFLVMTLAAVGCANFSHNPGASRSLANSAEKSKIKDTKLRDNFYKGIEFQNLNSQVFKSIKDERFN